MRRLIACLIVVGVGGVAEAQRVEFNWETSSKGDHCGDTLVSNECAWGSECFVENRLRVSHNNAFESYCVDGNGVHRSSTGGKILIQREDDGRFDFVSFDFKLAGMSSDPVPFYLRSSKFVQGEVWL